jgi:hypothetical protein
MSTLLDVNRTLADGPHKSLAHFFPVENLAGIERLREIESRR